MNWSPHPYFVLILDALDHIDLYRPATQAEFVASPLIQDGIVLRLQVIGETLHQMGNADESDASPRSERQPDERVLLRALSVLL